MGWYRTQLYLRSVFTAPEPGSWEETVLIFALHHSSQAEYYKTLVLASTDGDAKTKFAKDLKYHSFPFLHGSEAEMAKRAKRIMDKMQGKAIRIRHG